MAWRSSGTNNTEMVDKLTRKSIFGNIACRLATTFVHCADDGRCSACFVSSGNCVECWLLMNSFWPKRNYRSDRLRIYAVHPEMRSLLASYNVHHENCILSPLIKLLLHYRLILNRITGFGVITSDHVEDGFRRVDRKFFVPRVRHTIYEYYISHCFCISKAHHSIKF